MSETNPFLLAVERKARMLAPAARATCESNPELTGWLLNTLGDWALEAYGPGVFDDAARGYARYSMHVGRAATAYEEAGRYTPESLEDIEAGVYGDDGVMVPYMWGLILAYGFWPSLVGHLRMYRDVFLDSLPPDASVLELASGHGVLGLLAVKHRTDATVRGYDLSPPAVSIATRLANASGLADRAHFQVQDVLDLQAAGAPGQFDGVVAAMLAEHLEDPARLFHTIAHHLAPGGRAFVGTALESPQRDHIYEFHRESEPILMAEAAGLRVVSLISDSSSGRSGARFDPRSLAMILEHRRGR
jgi:2-polyprenyl-3-methyl-5-hydroxy-6-metoxy-1,4-benzoquinol methylase